MTETVYVFTDGGEKNNGGKGCTAAWGVFFDDEEGTLKQPHLSPLNEAGSIEKDPSNQRAELYAIDAALQKCVKIAPGGEWKEVVIVTDSQYSIDALTKWYKNWEKNGWKTYNKSAVKHVDLIKTSRLAIETLQQSGITLTFRHVNSHLIAPKEKTSFEYALWYGNYMVDKSVTYHLNSGGVPQVKGTFLKLDLDGVILEEKGMPFKIKKPVTKTVVKEPQRDDYVKLDL